MSLLCDKLPKGENTNQYTTCSHVYVTIDTMAIFSHIQFITEKEIVLYPSCVIMLGNWKMHSPNNTQPCSRKRETKKMTVMHSYTMLNNLSMGIEGW